MVSFERAYNGQLKTMYVVFHPWVSYELWEKNFKISIFQKLRFFNIFQIFSKTDENCLL